MMVEVPHTVGDAGTVCCRTGSCSSLHVAVDRCGVVVMVVTVVAVVEVGAGVGVSVGFVEVGLTVGGADEDSEGLGVRD